MNPWHLIRHYREPLIGCAGYLAAYLQSAHLPPKYAPFAGVAAFLLTALVKGWKPEKTPKITKCNDDAVRCPDKCERPAYTPPRYRWIGPGIANLGDPCVIYADGTAGPIPESPKQCQHHAPLRENKTTHDSRDYPPGEWVITSVELTSPNNEFIIRTFPLTEPIETYADKVNSETWVFPPLNLANLGEAAEACHKAEALKKKRGKRKRK